MFRMIGRSRMSGMRGDTIRAKRNVAKWQREGGQFLRMLMASHKAADGNFDPDSVRNEAVFSIRGRGASEAASFRALQLARHPSRPS
eukprot:846164-Alexandrium_andersonii.AAC.1